MIPKARSQSGEIKWFACEKCPVRFRAYISTQANLSYLDGHAVGVRA